MDLSRLKESAHRGGSGIVRWSIDHPYTVLAFYLGIFFLAILAIGWVMPLRMMPYVESPTLGVVTMMPGLSAQETELYISKPLEEQLQYIKNVRYLRSVSQDGLSVVSLEFPYHTDMQKALVELQALMNVAQANLPMTGANLKPSWVVAFDPLNLPVLTLALTGDSRWSMPRLRNLADNEILNRLKEVPGIRLVPSLSPDIRYNHAYMPIEVDEQAFGMSRDALYEKLKQWNVYLRRYFYPLVCDYSCYRSVSIKDPLIVARRVVDRVLTLPIYDGLELTDVETICEIIMSFQRG